MGLRICDGWVCGSCACYAIGSLGQESSAESAMLSFCKLTLGEAPANKYKKAASEYDCPAAHYIFTAGPEGNSNNLYGQPYGTNFAAYIIKHGLGKVATTDKVANAKHHGTSLCQTWIFQPDRLALIKWYEEKTNPKPKAEPPPPPKPVEAPRVMEPIMWAAKPIVKKKVLRKRKLKNDLVW